MASKSQSPRTRKAPVTRSSPTTRTKTVLRESGTARSGSARTGTGSQKRTDVAASVPRVRPGGTAQEAETEATRSRFIPTWLQWTTFLLAVAGLGVSAYLTYAHYTEAALLGCAESGTVNCQKVTTSAQSYVFGIPVAVLGLAFYAFAVPVMSPWAWRLARLGNSTVARWVSDNLSVIRLVSIFVGVGFVLYLLYAELFMIDAICLYCTSVHVITFVLFALVVFAAAVWGLRPSTPETAD
ncbi:MAG: vitamin K epoxide reductase family protein [Streptosporangiaceae bacterium]|nr:vitamin K epoxide reductase family protein [Streptosporangiaceae bacterium]